MLRHGLRVAGAWDKVPEVDEKRKTQDREKKNRVEDRKTLPD